LDFRCESEQMNVLFYGSDTNACLSTDGPQITEFVQESFKGDGFVARIHVGPVHVLNQRDRSCVGFGHLLSHDGRDSNLS
jgi:hypothetical protein